MGSDSPGQASRNPGGATAAGAYKGMHIPEDGAPTRVRRAGGELATSSRLVLMNPPSFGSRPQAPFHLHDLYESYSTDPAISAAA
jgi:hypothetical protein